MSANSLTAEIADVRVQQVIDFLEGFTIETTPGSAAKIPNKAGRRVREDPD